MADGPLWLEHRRFAGRVLRELGVGGDAADHRIGVECESLLRELEKLDGQEADLGDLITRAVVNVISQFIFSTRADYNDSQVTEYLKHLSVLTHGDFVTLLITCFPWLPIGPMIRLSRGTRAIVASNDWMLELMRRRVEATRAAYQPDSGGGAPSNYVEAYLDEQRSRLATGRELGTFDDYQLCRSVYDIYMGGTESTSNVLRWALLFAAMHPPLQDRCRREVLTVTGGSRRPVRAADRQVLHYTQAFIEETLRLCTPLPLGVNIRVLENTQFQGYTIDKEDLILANLYATNHDPVSFPEPDKFDPDRFIDPDTGSYRRLAGVLPFSVGRRACLGEQLAQRELLIFFASLVRSFRFELGRRTAGRNNIRDVLLGSAGLIRAPGPHELLITRCCPE